MKIKIKSLKYFYRATILNDDNSHLTELTLWSDAFENCQVSTLSGVEDLLDVVDNKDFLKAVKKICVGRTNIVAIDVARYWVEDILKMFGQNIIQNAPYHSTNGNDRNIIMIKTTYP